jgi:hypothetical protein
MKDVQVPGLRLCLILSCRIVSYLVLPLILRLVLRLRGRAIRCSEGLFHSPSLYTRDQGNPNPNPIPNL